jgi:hypothetical protein
MHVAYTLPSLDLGYSTYISSPAYLIDFNKRQKKVGTKYIEAV